MKKTLLTVGAVIIGMIAVVFGTQAFQNSAISHEERVEKSFSDVEVQQKRRFDLIPKLVECVKSYNEYEYNALKEIIKERSSSMSDSDIKEIRNKVNVVAEQYPNLKAQENYKTLMNELALTENKIAKYREAYNAEVTEYRKYVRKFPARLFLSILGYECKDYTRLEFEKNSVDAPELGL